MKRAITGNDGDVSRLMSWYEVPIYFTRIDADHRNLRSTDAATHALLRLQMGAFKAM